MKHFGCVMVMLAMAVPVMAGPVAPVPEINAGSASAAITLLSGGLVVLKARKRK